MNARSNLKFCWFFTAWIAFSVYGFAATAADNPWASRPGSVLAPSDAVIHGSGGATVPASALSVYWESQRQSQRDAAIRHSAARYGDLGPHYSVPAPYNSGAIGPREFFSPGYYSGSYYNDCGYAPGLALYDCLYGINHFGRHRGQCVTGGCPRLLDDCGW
jgi:hypothetical protein